MLMSALIHNRGGLTGFLQALVLAACFNPSGIEVVLGGEPAAKGKPSGKIFFRLEGPGMVIDSRIGAFDMGDKKLLELTAKLPYQFQPGHGVTISPDGTTAAYLADPVAPPEGGVVAFSLFIRSLADPKGKGQNLGVQTTNLNIMGWSPDGKKVMVSTLPSDFEDDAQQWVDVRTKETTRVALPKFEAPPDSTDAWGHFIHDWSPDGKWYLTSCGYLKKGGEACTQLYLVKVDGTEARRLENIEFGRRGRLSPDGRKVLYAGRHREGNKSFEQLFVADVSGGKPVRVSQELNGDPPWHTCWSPDSKRIAYVWHNGPFGNEAETFLMMVDADGRNATPLMSQKAPIIPRFDCLTWR
jgi:dipeptidyl aminopeptidase/acylaminoacyl peptidase